MSYPVRTASFIVLNPLTKTFGAFIINSNVAKFKAPSGTVEKSTFIPALFLVKLFKTSVPPPIAATFETSEGSVFITSLNVLYNF